MTNEEKIPQLINDAPAIPRLGVREYNWWNEGLHGVAALGEATVFPQAVGMAASWNDQLMFNVADVISTEFRAKHFANQQRFGGSDWFAGLTVWSPNINIFRDPRWGRGQETYGEDPHLTSRLGVAFVKGLQGNDPKFLKVVATPKHYAVHSGPEATRHKDNYNPSVKDLEETYLPAFYATITEGKAQSIMCAYNAIDGAPACASNFLLKEKLRDQWGFKGFVVSDCGAVFDVYDKDNHAFTKIPEEATKAVFEAGMDNICGDAKEADHIRSALDKGLITEALIDQSLIRLFTARMQLGQFDPRTKVFPKITSRDNDTDAHSQLARRMAEESIVLLKNKNDFLPLSADIKNIAVIGPTADSLPALVGNYNGTPSKPVTPLKGMRARFGENAIHYAQGTGLIDPVQNLLPDNVLCVDKKCRQSGLTAEYFVDNSYSGKPLLKRVDKNAKVVWEREVASGAVRWTGFIKAPESGEYTMRYVADGGYRIWINDQVVINAWNVDWRPVIASGSVKMEAGKIYPIKIEAFQRGEQGDEHLVWSLPSNPGADAAIEIAKKSDVIVYVGGITAQVEGEEMPVPLPGFVGGDRTDLSLPRAQTELLKRLYATGKPVVIVLTNGSALAVKQEDQNATAILEAWYPGGQGGEAVASALAGDISPAGRLPVTFYNSLDDLPAFGDYSMQNRTYKYYKGEVLYPFGYGLSYTKFSYKDAKVLPAQFASGKLNLSVAVTNSGKMDSDEVVQVYLSRKDLAGSPIRSLIGFKRVHIAKGATQKVSFELSERDLSSVDENGKRALFAGKADLWIGGGQPEQRSGLVPAAGVATSVTIKANKDI
ncbi:MAG: glycoside hydrolase family 3 C-terminal domain-containing protein [Cellvibrio sp.]|nr:glycoside hydrolase family 3 C-terminal domain-containing protein [Cellvibrio sp.]